MKLIGIRNINEDLGDGYSDMSRLMASSKSGLKALGIDAVIPGQEKTNVKDDNRRVEKRAKISCVFGKNIAAIQSNSLDNVVMDKVTCFYTRIKKDSIFRFSFRNKADEKFVEFIINDINPDAGFEPDFYDITILENKDFDTNLDDDYYALKLISIKDTKNNF